MTMLGRVLLWGLVSCFAAGANAQPADPSLEVGAGLVCNSVQQVERYLAHYTKGDQSPDAAVQAVNVESHDANACALVSIAFVRGEQHAAVPAPGGQMRIVQIRVIAAQTPEGWAQFDDLVQYTAIFEKLEEA